MTRPWRRSQEGSEEVDKKGLTLGALVSRIIQAFKAVEADVADVTIEIWRTPKIFTDLLNLKFRLN